VSSKLITAIINFDSFGNTAKFGSPHNHNLSPRYLMGHTEPNRVSRTSYSSTTQLLFHLHWRAIAQRLVGIALLIRNGLSMNPFDLILSNARSYCVSTGSVRSESRLIRAGSIV
jgi:hypothetical protein